MNRRSFRARAAALVSAAFLTLGLGGCGDAEDEPSAEAKTATSQSSSDQPSQTDSASPSQDAESPQPGEEVDPTDLLDRMKAATLEAPSVRFAMAMNASSQRIIARGALAYAEEGSDDGNRMDMSMTVPGTGRMRVLLVDGEVFTSLTGQTPAGKYLKVDPDAPGMESLADQLKSMDPMGSFAAFDAGLQSVTYVGETVVAGETMHQYTLEVDSQDAAKAQGNDVTEGLPETISYQLLLDEQDRMRRVTFELPQVRTVMRMWAWGEPVDVTAPPADKVVEAPN